MAGTTKPLTVVLAVGFFIAVVWLFGLFCLDVLGLNSGQARPAFLVFIPVVGALARWWTMREPRKRP